MGLAAFNLNRARAGAEREAEEKRAAYARRIATRNAQQAAHNRAFRAAQAATAPEATTATCKNGHALIPGNVVARKDGARLCRQCMSDAGKRRGKPKDGDS